MFDRISFIYIYIYILYLYLSSEFDASNTFQTSWDSGIERLLNVQKTPVRSMLTANRW